MVSRFLWAGSAAHELRFCSGRGRFVFSCWKLQSRWLMVLDFCSKAYRLQTYRRVHGLLPPVGVPPLISLSPC